MADVTQLLHAIERGETQRGNDLLPLVYDELRAMARRKLRAERPGHTLDATALVHEAYLKLVGHDAAAGWAGRRHFFAAAAEAMRRILVDSARRKLSRKRGGDLARAELYEDAIAAPQVDADLLALDDALDRLADAHPRKAELVKLRYFAGMTLEEAAETLGIGVTTADRDWSYAKAWLFDTMRGKTDAPAGPGE